MAWFDSLFRRNPFEENAREGLRQMRENSKKPLPTQDGHYHEYDPGASQKWLYDKLKANAANSYAKNAATGEYEVWSHGKRVASGMDNATAVRLLRKLMHPWMSDEEFKRRWGS